MITKQLNHTYILKPQGRLDLHGGALLQQQLTEIARDYYRLWIIDLEGIDFIDTAGLGSLISGLNLSRQHQCRRPPGSGHAGTGTGAPAARGRAFALHGVRSQAQIRLRGNQSRYAA